MRQPGLRTSTKWACTALSVLFAAECVLSFFYNITYRRMSPTRSVLAWIMHGTLFVDLLSPDPGKPSSRLMIQPALSLTGQRIEWLPRRDADGTGYILPLWVPFLLTAAPAALFWRLDRRLVRGACEHCGYDRRGLATDTVCPECGKGPKT